MIYGPSSPHRHYQSDARLAEGRAADEVHLSKIDLLLWSVPAWHAVLGCRARCHGFNVGTFFHFQGVRSQAHCRLVSCRGGRGRGVGTPPENCRRFDGTICPGSGLGRGDSLRQRSLPSPCRDSEREKREATPVAPAPGRRDVQDGLHRSGPRCQRHGDSGFEVLYQTVEALRRGHHSSSDRGAAKGVVDRRTPQPGASREGRGQQREVGCQAGETAVLDSARHHGEARRSGGGGLRWSGFRPRRFAGRFTRISNATINDERR